MTDVLQDVSLMFIAACVVAHSLLGIMAYLDDVDWPDVRAKWKAWRS